MKVEGACVRVCVFVSVFVRARLCVGMHVSVQKKGNYCLRSSSTRGVPGLFSRPGSLCWAFVC